MSAPTDAAPTGPATRRAICPNAVLNAAPRAALIGPHVPVDSSNAWITLAGTARFAGTSSMGARIRKLLSVFFQERPNTPSSSAADHHLSAPPAVYLDPPFGGRAYPDALISANSAGAIFREANFTSLGPVGCLPSKSGLAPGLGSIFTTSLATRGAPIRSPKRLTSLILGISIPHHLIQRFPRGAGFCWLPHLEHRLQRRSHRRDE
jgi:hypothetical protein